MLKAFYSSSTNASTVFDLTDAMGLKIISMPVANLSTMGINASSIASGLYLWKSRNDNALIQTGKVSIQNENINWNYFFITFHDD